MNELSFLNENYNIPLDISKIAYLMKIHKTPCTKDHLYLQKSLVSSTINKYTKRKSNVQSPPILMFHRLHKSPCNF